MREDKLDRLAQVLSRQIEREVFERKSAPAKEVLKLIGAGAFLATSLAVPNFPKALKPFLKDNDEYAVWKRFNIPYLKRTLQRLERQKLVEIGEEKGRQMVKITLQGRQKILTFALEELSIHKPISWDKRWRLVSFDLPENLSRKRKLLVEYLRAWKFYPLHKSVYLHAYPCFKEIDFLREYLGVTKYVKFFIVAEVENEALFKDFFGLRV